MLRLGPRLQLALAAALVCLALPSAAAAAAYLPPRGQVFHCGIGGYGAGAVGDFTRQAGKHPPLYQYFVNWRGAQRDLNFIAGLLRNTDRARARVILHIAPPGGRPTPRAIARGATDGFLVALGRLLAQHGHPTYVRPMSEMNNGANPYSAYDLRGRSRGRAYSAGSFKQAWRRTVSILRGGTVAAINARLRRLGLPAVATSEAELARPQVAFLWVPLTFGNPEIARNHPRHWWPGSGYVDWVGSTWYSRHPASEAFSRFYRNRLWRGKPFTLAEYGVWGRDESRFIRVVHGWVRRHPRARMLCYYQSALLKPEFRLSTHPRARAALRRTLRSRRYPEHAPEYR
jgi:hypothetical protein